MHKFLALVTSAGLLATPIQAAPPKASPARGQTLRSAFVAIHSRRFVDLTHTFRPGIPHFKGFPDETVNTIYTVPHDGFASQVFTHVGQWGTHIDAPAHFHAGLKTVDQIDCHDFFLQLVVLDVHQQVAANPDYVVSMRDVRDWEKRHGAIPQGAFVALRTDWSKRWPDEAALQNKDKAGTAHYPGWSSAVLTYLYTQRKVTATGHETTDTDTGLAATKGDFSLESYVLGTNHFQIEMMANLDQVPEQGALIIVTFPKPEGATGFPARAIAILP